MASKIQIKRTLKEFNNPDLQQGLQFGEPFYVKNSDGEFLVIGSNSGKYIPQEKRVQFVDDELVEKAVFYDDGFVYSDGSSVPVDSGQQPLNIVSNGVTTKTYDGSSSVSVTASDVGAIDYYTSLAQTPTVNETTRDKVATVGYVKDLSAVPAYQGYTVVDVGTSTYSALKWNQELRFGAISGSLNVTLPTPNGVGATAEIRICLYCSGNTSFNVNTVSPSESDWVFKILGMDDFGTLTSGNYYEISFSYIGDIPKPYNNNKRTFIISCLVNEIPIVF